MWDVVVDIEPREWVIESKTKVRYRIYNPKTSELIAGALIFGYGGNISISGETDENGQYEVDVEHKMPGFTSHVIVLPDGDKTIGELAETGRTGADCQCPNGSTHPVEEKDRELFRPVKAGEAIDFVFAPKNQWEDLLVLHKTPIRAKTETRFDFDVPSECLALHIRINWTGYGNRIHASWTNSAGRTETAPAMTEMRHPDHPRLAIAPLCLQPGRDGLIHDPAPGRWTISLDTAGVRTDSTLVSVEVFAKLKEPAAMKDVEITLHGCGLDKSYKTGPDGSVHIQEVPTEKGVVTMTYWKAPLLYRNMRTIDVV